VIQDATRAATEGPKPVRCAIYTRKSTEKGLEKDFNSLHAQREACVSFIRSQAAEGWTLVDAEYSDGGYSGANTERPALERLLRDIDAGKIDCLCVHRVDRLSRSLLSFAMIIEKLNRRGVAFVSVTQQFNTASSMGRLTLHILLSFAQFEREMIAERTRDKIAASKRRGAWCGGHPPMLGYDIDARGGRLVVNPEEAGRVRQIYSIYLEKGSLLATVAELARRGWQTKTWTSKSGRTRIGRPFDKVAVSRLLSNPVFRGQVEYRGEIFDGKHEAIVSPEQWQRAQTMLAKHARAGGSETRNKHAALLKGVLRCGPCHCAMTPTHTTKGSKRYRYYACTRAQKEGSTVCPTRIVPAGAIEQAVIDRIRGIGQDPVLVAAVIAQARERLKSETEAFAAERDARADEVRRVNAEIRRLVGDAGPDSGTRIADQLAEVQERLRAAEGALADAERRLDAIRDTRVDDTDLMAAVGAFDPVWDALFPRERERIVKLLLESIDVGAGAEEMRLNFRPSGIKTLAAEVAAGESERDADVEGGEPLSAER